MINENTLRNQICAICNKMWSLGWGAANDGNVSVKLNDDRILITPSGISKDSIAPEMIVTVNRAGVVLSGGKPSSEMKMHLRCYDERDDIGGVVHSHAPCATAFAVANKPLDDYSMIEAVLTIGSVPVTDYATPSTNQVGDSIAGFLKDHDVLLLGNHGALSVGQDLSTAFNRMETLEHWAKVSINARILGGAVELPRDKIEELCSMREQYGIVGRHPGYKKYNKNMVLQ